MLFKYILSSFATVIFQRVLWKILILYSISGGAARKNNIICIIIVFNMFVYSCNVKYAIYIPNCLDF